MRIFKPLTGGQAADPASLEKDFAAASVVAESRVGSLAVFPRSEARVRTADYLPLCDNASAEATKRLMSCGG